MNILYCASAQELVNGQDFVLLHIYRTLLQVLNEYYTIKDHVIIQARANSKYLIIKSINKMN